MMIWISPLLAAIILGVIIVGVLGLTFTSKKARTIYLRNQEALGAVNGGIEELISGKQIIQSFGLEKVSTDHMTDLNTRLFTRERQSGFMGQLIMPLVNFINQIATSSLPSKAVSSCCAAISPLVTSKPFSST